MIEAIAKTSAASATNLIGDTTKLEEKTKSITFMLAGWKPFSNESSEWFDPEWMFGVYDEFDIIIGNPPYISTERLQEPLNQHNSRGNFMKSTQVVLMFIATIYHKGLYLSRYTNGGLCAIIFSNKWMRSAYGKKLRKYFASKNPILLIDLGPDIFENATVDTSILLIQNKPNGNTTKALTLTREPRDSNLAEFINLNAVEISGLSEKTWFIGNDAQQRLKLKIEETGKPLKEWKLSISYGVKTGLNEAFIIDSATRERLCREDSRSAEILKPLLRGKDIKRYHYNWAGLWLILAKYGSNKYMKNDYPAIFGHLSKFEEKLRDRGQCKYTRATNIKNGDYGGQHHWIELDNNPGNDYVALFEKEKIAWQEMAQHPQFTYDEQGYFCLDTCRILTGINIKYLTGFFNSKCFNYVFSKFYAGGGLGDKGVRYKSEFMKVCPIPAVTTENKHIVEKIEDLLCQISALKNQDSKADTTELEHQIDQLVYQLYDLTPDEIAIVEGNHFKT